MVSPPGCRVPAGPIAAAFGAAIIASPPRGPAPSRALVALRSGLEDGPGLPVLSTPAVCRLTRSLQTSFLGLRGRPAPACPGPALRLATSRPVRSSLHYAPSVAPCP